MVVDVSKWWLRYLLVLLERKETVWRSLLSFRGFLGAQRNYSNALPVTQPQCSDIYMYGDEMYLID